jgi:CheY-like chemotaxis protein
MKKKSGANAIPSKSSRPYFREIAPMLSVRNGYIFKSGNEKLSRIWWTEKGMMQQSAVIFILENSTDYLFLLDQAFRRVGLLNPVKVARYGNEAILYLKGIGIYNDRQHYPIPQLILIDMSIADGSSLSVVGWIRRHPQFQQVPIVMLVHPTQQRYLQKALDLGANSYFVKRDDFDGLIEMIQRLELPVEAKAENGEAQIDVNVSKDPSLPVP